MFSFDEKQKISEAVQVSLRETNHPELDLSKEIPFQLHVWGSTMMSWADILNNGAIEQ